MSVSAVPADLPDPSRAGRDAFFTGRDRGVSRSRSRRRLQVALGGIWLVDAALQFQPYMFTRDFVTKTVEPAAAGTPGWVARPAAEAAHLMLTHLAVDNTLFALTQVFIAAAVCYRPLVKVGLAVSFVWAVGIWWLAEGLGGITTAMSPVAGAPGAAILYALAAVVLWPHTTPESGMGGVAAAGGSVADTSPLGRVGSRAVWLVLWAGLAVLALEPANRAPGALRDTLTAAADGEPRWIATLDAHLAAAAGHGTPASTSLAVALAAVAAGVLHHSTRPAAVVLAVTTAAVIWVGEDFGAVLTGAGTDVNTGPLLALLAAAYWPHTHRPSPVSFPDRDRFVTGHVVSTSGTRPAQGMVTVSHHTSPWRIRMSRARTPAASSAAAAAVLLVAGGCTHTAFPPQAAAQTSAPASALVAPPERLTLPVAAPRPSTPIADGPPAAASTVTGSATASATAAGADLTRPATPRPSLSARPVVDRFTGRRVVAYYGAAGTAGLGVLGAGTPAQAWTALDHQAHLFDTPGRAAVRCFELITSVAADSPGGDGNYRNRVDPTVIAPYLATVRAHHGMLLLDVQPGRSDFLTEAHALTPLLTQPDVGLALDPEWRMQSGQVPGQVIGSVTAQEVNQVSAWLDSLTATHHLPAKLFVVHQFTDPEITDEPDLAHRRHLHEILNVDGFGPIGLKRTVYAQLAARSPYPLGLKLFYRQDPTLMTPTQIDTLTPTPQLIDYQ